MHLNPADKKTLIHQFLQSPLVPISTLSNRMSQSLRVSPDIIENYLCSVTETRAFGRVLKKNVLSDLEAEHARFVYQSETQNSVIGPSSRLGSNTSHNNTHNSHSSRNNTHNSHSSHNNTHNSHSSRNNTHNSHSSRNNTHNHHSSRNNTHNHHSSRNDHFQFREMRNGTVNKNESQSDIEQVTQYSVPGQPPHPRANNNNTVKRKLETARRINNLERYIKKTQTPNKTEEEYHIMNTASLNYLKPRPDDSNQKQLYEDGEILSNHESDTIDKKSFFGHSHLNDKRPLQKTEPVTPQSKPLSTNDKITKLLEDCPIFTFKNVPNSLMTEYLVVYDFFCKFREVLKIDTKNKTVDSLVNKKSDLIINSVYDSLKDIEPYKNKRHLINTHITLESFHDLFERSYNELFEKLFTFLQSERKKEKLSVIMEMVNQAIDLFWDDQCITIVDDDEKTPENILNKKYENFHNFNSTNTAILIEHTRTDWPKARPTFGTLLSFFQDMRRFLRKTAPLSVDLRVIQKELSRKKIKQGVISPQEHKSSQEVIEEPDKTTKKPRVIDSTENEQMSPFQQTKGENHDKILFESKLKLLKFFIDIIFETVTFRNQINDWNIDLEADCYNARELIRLIRVEIRQIRTMNSLRTRDETENDKKNIENTTQPNEEVVESKSENPQPSIEIKNLKKLPPLPATIQELDLLLSRSLCIHEALTSLIKETSLGCELYQLDRWAFVYVDKKILAYRTPSLEEIAQSNSDPEQKSPEISSKKLDKDREYILIDKEVKRMLSMIGGTNLSEAVKFCFTL